MSVLRAGRLRAAVIAVAAALASILATTTNAVATPGEFVAEVHFSQDCESGVGVGIAYDADGHLWVSCYASRIDLMRTDVHTGTVEQKYEVAGGLGSLAYDGKDNALWAGWGNGTSDVTYIQLDATKSVSSYHTAFEDPADRVCGLDDGMGYDATDETLYISDDCSTTIHQRKTDGTLVREFPWAGTECYNSGVAIGGELLFEGSDGCSHVWVVNKVSNAAAFDFSTFTEEDPNHRDEGLSCDPETFESSHKQVMWSKEAYSPNRAIAVEIPEETCGAGGKPPKEEAEPTTLATELHGGIKSGETITVPEGTAVVDHAKLSGANAAKAGGSVTYTVYTDSECKNVFASAGTVTVSGGEVPASEAVTFSTSGTYYWTASYSGDSANRASESKCGAEQVSVVKAAAPLSAGYWKTHMTSGSPATQQYLPQYLGGYKVETVTQAGAVFAAMTCSNAPKSTQNAIGCLAAQLLATELNLANNSPTCIVSTVQKANAWLSGTSEDGVSGVGYSGPYASYTLTQAQRNEAIALKGPFDTYNNGGGC